MAFLAAAAAFGGCGAPAEAPRARHLVLVTLDTLRADHVGAYGGAVETPHLDRIAASGALAEDATAHTPLTRPSHVAMMTGLLPTETGIRDNVSPSRVPEVPLLAEVLTSAGFRSAAFVSSVVLAAESGLGRGFEVYSDDFEARPEDPRFLDTAQKRGDETLAEALSWLSGRSADERFFLWLHLYDPHDPYEPPEPWASRFRDRPYAGEVAWTDELVGRLEEALERQGVVDETLLVVTSDHGEGLGEHGETLHGFFAYQSTLAVPLLLRGPGVNAGARLEQPVGLVDLYPTVLDLLGVMPPEGAAVTGRSLAGALAGGEEPAPAPIYAESLVPLRQFGWSDLRVVRQGPYKYIQAPRPELYDLEADPSESRNLADEERRQVRAAVDALTVILDAERAAEPAEGAPDPELLERLGALGYIGGGAASSPAPGADPKDKIDEFRMANELMRQGLTRLHEGDHGGSAADFEALLSRGIESAEIHLYLARSLTALGQDERAVRHYERTVERSPVYAEAWVALARAAAAAGSVEGALDAITRGVAALPEHPVLPRELGRMLRRWGRPDEARQAFARSLELDPDDAYSHAMMGEALRDLGELGKAAAAQRRAVELAPDRASYWNALGMTLGGSGALAEAEMAFARAVELDAGSQRYAYNRGLALARLGRRAEARRLFARALELDPGFEPARRSLAEVENLAGDGTDPGPS